MNLSVKLVVLTTLVTGLLTGCTTELSVSDRQQVSDSPSTESAAPPDAEGAPDPTRWGPTQAEITSAAEQVAGWSPQRLAGQLIVGRFHGTDPAVAAQLLLDHHLAGVSITNANVVDEAQVRAMTSAINSASAQDGRDYPPIIGVDQEGGSVAHLRGIATEFPAFTSAGAAIEASADTGAMVVRQAAMATGLELRSFGFSWVFAPVADVTIGAADPTIGSRSASTDPKVAAIAVAEAVRGFVESGVVSTTKHFPGHGAALNDSHETLPVLDSSLAELDVRDLPPFQSAVASGAPVIMLGHLELSRIAPGLPASLSPTVYEILRDELGFEGVTITDSMGMGAVAGVHKPAVAAINAGADLILMPVNTAETHRILAAAITSGEISRERAEEAATRVVALQYWHKRIAGLTPIPADVSVRAQVAAEELVRTGH